MKTNSKVYRAALYMRLSKDDEIRRDPLDHACRLSALILATASSAPDCWEPHRITLSPSAKNLFTVAKPIPQLPPVTIAALFLNNIFLLLKLNHGTIKIL